MIRNLVLIAVAGFFTAVICLTAAVSFGGPDLFTNHDWHRNFGDWEDDVDDQVERRLDEAADAPANRELPWTGESLDIDIPAEVRFVQKEGPATVVVSGPSGLVHQLQLVGGRISGDDDEDGWRRVSITITAPRITEFRLDDEDTLVVDGYDQDRLMLTMEGRADVSIQGRAESLTLNIGESADADLSQLRAGEVLANVRDYGEVSLAPQARADVKVADSGKVTLVSRPGQLHSDVTGRGKIIEAGAAPESAPKTGEVAQDATS
ncbi:GIN domain-containing protein [Phenylobacterium sp.]|jgi:hypothetical protein|uniref:GIN domain-containing protein n=1 Tax=Phenylobacterium sp. TaxID=1871053 RepID=UPI002E3505A7|nr:DUF2807 domain-containing protein [Phenylobacterium sp.]HEX2558646.1 DUF2807 domain-containing protein [Phenylobacterium sp.]